MSFPPPPPGPGQPDPNQPQFGAPQQYGPPQGFGAPQPYPSQYGAPQYGGGFPPQFGPASGDPGTLDLPWYGIGMVDAVKRFFQKYVRFDGRASRGEYWWSALGVGLIGLVIYVIIIAGVVAQSSVLVGLGGLLIVVFLLGVILPGIAVSVRRLHDGGFSGWLYLVGLIPFFGGIVLLVLLCLESKPEGAQYDRVAGAPGGYYGGPPSGY